MPGIEIDVPLCRMIPMKDVREPLKTDIQKLKAEFSVGTRGRHHASTFLWGVSGWKNQVFLRQTWCHGLSYGASRMKNLRKGCWQILPFRNIPINTSTCRMAIIVTLPSQRLSTLFASMMHHFMLLFDRLSSTSPLHIATCYCMPWLTGTSELSPFHLWFIMFPNT